MAPKSGNGVIPQPLPPSVEEAYRRKCRFLRHRTNEIEEVNDAGRQRLARLKRQVEKLRLERAFLLEQMAKRTSTNVEDSDGSPSPPPTPKDKPLRMKRGQRKTSLADDAANGTNMEFSSLRKTNGVSARATTNGTHPTSAYELYCDQTRPSLVAQNKSTIEIEDELSNGWKDLAEETRESFQDKYETLAQEEQKAAEEEEDELAAAQAADDEDEEADKEKELDTDDDEGGKKRGDDDDDLDGDDAESKSERKAGSDDDEDIEMVDGEDTRQGTPKDD